MRPSAPIIAALLLLLVVSLALFVFLRSSGPSAPDLDDGLSRVEGGSREARRSRGESLDEPTTIPRPNDGSPPSETDEVEVGPEPVVEEEAREIRGVVVGADGLGIADAEIFCEAVGAGPLDEWRRFTAALGASSDEARRDPDRRATSDVEGRFRFAAPKGAKVVQVGVFHPVHGFGLEGGVRLRGPLTDVRVEMASGVVIFGEVRSASGDAIPEVTVHVSAMIAEGGIIEVATATTDAMGAYRTHPLPYPLFRLSVPRVPGYRSKLGGNLVPVPHQREVRQDFTLEPARRLFGRVVGEEGKLVDFAAQAIRIAGNDHARWLAGNELKIFADPRDPGEDLNYNRLFHREGKLDVARSTYEIELDDDSFRWISLRVGPALVAKYEITEGEDERDLVVDLAALPPLEPRRGLEVILVDDATSSPVEDATIDIWTGTDDPMRTRGMQQTREGPHPGGRARLTDLRHGPAIMTVRSPGRAVGFARFELREDGTPASVTVRLRPATGRLRGRVVDAEGAPIPKARLRFLTPDGELTSDPWTGFVRTDVEGRFEMEHLAPVAGLLSVAPYDDAPVLIAVDATPPGEELLVKLDPGVVIVLQPTGAKGPFSFRVLDSRGRPLHDDHRDFMTRWVPALALRVPETDLIVEVVCPGHRPSTRKVKARRGLEVELPLERLVK
ncbi:MAG: carboxypeptidase-like regulatory domain-containing protein [Planctomycetota bacterium]